MRVKIGANIKKLRTENNITQDTLATAIGVTPQAISRWEAEGGYPDIELLPAIADFFSVSTDELLGYKLSERENKLAQIKKEIASLAEVGTLKERIAFARTALTQFPADCEMKENLAVCLYLLYNETKDETILPEAESLALYVIENCKDEDIRYDAINTLVSLYSDTKRTDKVHEMLNLLTPMKHCREFAKSTGIGAGNNEIYKQDLINKLTDCLGAAITDLVLDNELPNDSNTWDTKIQMLQTANQLYLLIYGENLLFYHWRVALNHWLISTYQIAQGNKEDALCSLEKMCQHAIAYDIAFVNDHGKQYTSVLVDKLTYRETTHEPKEHSQSFYMLDRLQENRYDPIRNDKRFNKTEKTLQEYAR